MEPLAARVRGLREVVLAIVTLGVLQSTITNFAWLSFTSTREHSACLKAVTPDGSSLMAAVMTSTRRRRLLCHLHGGLPNICTYSLSGKMFKVIKFNETNLT